jgi:hypothetical protein
MHLALLSVFLMAKTSGMAKEGSVRRIGILLGTFQCSSVYFRTG